MPAASYQDGRGSCAVIQQHVRLHFETTRNTRNVVDRDISLRPLDPAEVGAVDAALMGQRLLAETTLRPKATHIPRQNVPQRSLVSLFHKADFGSITLLRRPLLSHIRNISRVYCGGASDGAGCPTIRSGGQKRCAMLSHQTRQ